MTPCVRPVPGFPGSSGVRPGLRRAREYRSRRPTIAALPLLPRSARARVVAPLRTLRTVRSPIGEPDIRFRLVPTSRERLRARRVAHGLIAGAARIAVESGEFGDLLADEVEADELALVLAEVENLANRHATLSRGEGEFDS